jgi:hypothetical protein
LGTANKLQLSGCTTKKRSFVILGVLTFALLFKLPTFWEIVVIEKPNCSGLEGAELVPTPLRLNPHYQVYSFYISHVVQIFLPFILLCYLNTMITRYLRRSLQPNRHENSAGAVTEPMLNSGTNVFNNEEETERERKQDLRSQLR